MDKEDVVHNFDQIKLNPIESERSYVFVSITEPSIKLIEASLSTFRESEGVSLIIDKVVADHWNLAYENTYGLITIGIYSSLNATGLTAKISAGLAAEKIPCNVMAAYHHDHLLVPEILIEKAMKIINGLS